MQKVFLHGGAILVAHRERWKVSLITRKLFVMVKLFVLVALGCLQARASGWGQSISIHVNNASLEHVFTLIEGQSSYRFVYTKEELSAAGKVSLSVKDRDIVYVLDQCFKNQPLQYRLKEQYVIVSAKEQKQVGVEKERSFRLTGLITDEEGLPLEGVTVSVKGLDKATATDRAGRFVLELKDGSVTIVVTSVGYASREIDVAGKSELHIVMQRVVNSLDETVVIAYGKTTRRLNTGNIGKVTAADIEKQPVSNVLAALQGRVPGLVITQTTGVSGGLFNVEIRGRSSLDKNLSRNDPLIIIDGVPFEPGIERVNQISSAANNPRQASEGGLSALNALSLNDIESIEVLKDADATAIYGSRGANGVILITLKKAYRGKLQISTNLSMGISKPLREPKFLTTAQYVQMRKEAFRNDGIQPTIGNAYDILLWDSTRQSDLQKQLIRENAQVFNMQLSLSGGTASHYFLFSSSFREESNLFSKSLKDKKINFRLSGGYSTADKKMEIGGSVMLNVEKNELLRIDLSSFLYLPPNIRLFDSLGNLNWEEKGVIFDNPLAELLKSSNSETVAFQGSTFLNYSILQRLKFKITSGYSLFNIDEHSTIPRRALSPFSNILPSALFGNKKIINYNCDGFAEYDFRKNKINIQFTSGVNLQGKETRSSFLTGTNYTSDLLLSTPEAAGNLTIAFNDIKYKYASVFGRVFANYKDRYLLQLSGRADASSRFGPEKRLAGFGALGFAWILSEEKFFKKQKFCNFLKLRGSYGVTGNDQIGDYRYYDLWNNTPFTFLSQPGLRPAGLFIPDFSWERNRKAEIGIELSAIKNRLFLVSSFYVNRSGNQLTNYRLPAQTGFNSVVKNLDALVQNSGLELSLDYSVFKLSRSRLNIMFNISFPRNELMKFPGLAQSSYANVFEIGHPVSTVKGLKFTGLNDNGVYTFRDLNDDGILNSRDYQPLLDPTPNYLGGFTANYNLGQISLSAFLEFRKQKGRNSLYYARTFIPGTISNQPVSILERWQQTGDKTDIQKFTTVSSGSAAATALQYFSSSDGIYGDASFIRGRNLSLSYSLSDKFTKRMGFQLIQIYINCQNLFTITSYEVGDPETQNIYQLPPLRTIIAGVQIKL